MLYIGVFTTIVQTMSGKRVLDRLFYFGIALLTIGTLFKIQHWLYGRIMQGGGLVTEVLFFFFVVLEIATSKKASVRAKAAFASFYVIVPFISFLYVPALLLIGLVFILGSAYLRSQRKKFLFTRLESK